MKQLKGPNSLLEPRLRKYAWAVYMFLLLAFLEGFVALLYLLSFPSDDGSRLFLGFSGARLVLVGLMSLGLLLSALLASKAWKGPKWAAHVGSKLLGSPETLPRLLLGLFLAALMGAGWLGLFHPDVILSINKPLVLRFAAPAIWLALVLLQLTVIWGIFRAPHKWTLPKQFWDVMAMLVLFSIAFAPRARMTTYGLPYQSVWDEVVTYPQALHMLSEPGMKPVSDVPGYGPASYGDLLVYIAAGGEVLGLVNGLRTQQIISIDDYVSPPPGVPSIYSAVHPSGIPLRYPRLALALINSLAPLGIYIACRRYLNTCLAPAFGAGYIYAFLSRDVIYYSSYILPDALATTLFVFLLIAALEGIDDDRGRFSPWVAAGLLAGMILSVTIRLAGVVSLPFLAFLLARYRQRPVARLAAIGASIFGGFILTSPYTLIDLPNTLAKWTAFSWYHELHASHRLASLLYYFQGAFMPGFNSSYVDSSEGSVGLGLLVGILAVIGLWKLIPRFPRQAIFILFFFALHLYAISPVFQRYTRHALVLYPLVCIFAGAGLSVLTDGLTSILCRWEMSKNHKIANWTRRRHESLNHLAPLVVLAAFLLASGRQANYTARYVARTSSFHPVQAEVTRYLNAALPTGGKVGVLESLPLIETDLIDNDVIVERLSANDTVESMKARGITYVVWSDRLADSYSLPEGAPTDNLFALQALKAAEFGYASLQYEGYPAHNLYMFVARLIEE